MKAITLILIFTCFSAFSQTSKNVGRSPAIEPGFSISIDDTPKTIPSKNSYYDFAKKRNVPEVRNRNASQSDFLNGRIPAAIAQSRFNWGTFSLIVVLAMFPLAIRYALYVGYKKRLDEEKSTDKPANVVSLKDHKKSDPKNDDDKPEEYKKAG